MRPKLIFLSLAVCLSSAAHSEWLTMAGVAGDPTSDYFQFNPDSIQKSGDLRFVGVRASRADAQGMDGFAYRSFDATAVVNCKRGSASYARASYFDRPNFGGAPVKVQVYVEGRMPVVCWVTADGRPTRLIKSLCGTDALESIG